MDHEELLAQQQSLHTELNQLRQEQQMLERERQQLLHDQEQFQIHVQQADERDRIRTYTVSKKNNKKQRTNGRNYYGINLFN